VVIIGGTTGHFGSGAVALAMGAAKVIAPGQNRAVLDQLVEKFGAWVCPVVLTGNEAKDAKAIRDRADGLVDCVLDPLGRVTDFSPVRACIISLRRGGTVVLMGGVMPP
jgi:alcohol dehydrogenase